MIGFGQIVTQVVRFTLTRAIAFSFVRGWHLGRWIAVSLLTISGGFSVVFAFTGELDPMSLMLEHLSKVCSSIGIF